jgi:hypothetical protein
MKLIGDIKTKKVLKNCTNSTYVLFFSLDVSKKPPFSTCGEKEFYRQHKRKEESAEEGTSCREEPTEYQYLR